MKKHLMILSLLLTFLFGGCSSKPEKASDLYRGCIFAVKNGDITSYGVYIEVKDRVSDFSIMNLRTYDEAFVNDVLKYQADTSRIYYRTDTILSACHQDGYGDHSYFMSATQPLYKIPEDKYRKLLSKLESATIEVKLSDTKTDKTYTFNTVLPVVETEEAYHHKDGE